MFLMHCFVYTFVLEKQTLVAETVFAGYMAMKQCFFFALCLQEKWMENSVSWETMFLGLSTFRKHVSRFSHLQKIWVGDNFSAKCFQACPLGFNSPG